MDFGNFVFGGGAGFGLMPGGMGRFENRLRCHSVAFIHRPELEAGGKIILPPSALDMLTRLHIEYPMLFELSNPNLSRRMHCGVLEFVAEEGVCYMPFWMMQNLLIEEGKLVTISSTSLSRGTFVKIQPHTSTFLDISNPKAVLENSLRKFAALTKGDVIVINYNSKNYYLTVLETKPADAISILETDISVDFAPPLDYKEPERTQRQDGTAPTQAMSIPGRRLQTEDDEEEEEDTNKKRFVPFGGSGARIDGKGPSPFASTPPTASSFGSLPKSSNGSLPKSSYGSIPKSSTLPSPSSSPAGKSPAGKLTFGGGVEKPANRFAKKEDSDEDEEEDDKKSKFVAFGGKGYTLK